MKKITVILTLTMLATTSCKDEFTEKNPTQVFSLENSDFKSKMPAIMDTDQILLDSLTEQEPNDLLLTEPILANNRTSVNSAKVTSYQWTVSRYVLSPGLIMPATGIKRVNIKFDPTLSDNFVDKIRCILNVINARRDVEGEFEGHRWRLKYYIVTGNNFDIYVDNDTKPDRFYSGNALLDGRNPSRIKRTIFWNENCKWNNAPSIGGDPSLCTFENNQIAARFMHLLFHTLGVVHDQQTIRNNQVPPDFRVLGTFNWRKITRTVKRRINVGPNLCKFLSTNTFTRVGGPADPGSYRYEPTVFNYAILAGFYGTAE